MFSRLKGLLTRVVDSVAKRVSGKCDPVVDDRLSAGVPSRLVMLDDHDEEPLGYLPPGHPVVSFSPRALELHSAAKRAYDARKAASEAPKPGPRPGSLEWRVQQKRT